MASKREYQTDDAASTKRVKMENGNGNLDGANNPYLAHWNDDSKLFTPPAKVHPRAFTDLPAKSPIPPADFQGSSATRRPPNKHPSPKMALSTPSRASRYRTSTWAS